jgi:hypothetical protein
MGNQDALYEDQMKLKVARARPSARARSVPTCSCLRLRRHPGLRCSPGLFSDVTALSPPRPAGGARGGVPRGGGGLPAAHAGQVRRGRAAGADERAEAAHAPSGTRARGVSRQRCVRSVPAGKLEGLQPGAVFGAPCCRRRREWRPPCRGSCGGDAGAPRSAHHATPPTPASTCP